MVFGQNRIVIPTGAQRSGGTCCSPSHIAKLNGTAALPFVIPSEAEGSAVQRTSLGNVFRPKQNCHPDRSVPGFPATQHWTRQRVRLSAKERRMKRVNATNFTGNPGERSGGTCCSPSHIAKLNESAALPSVIPSEPGFSCHAALDTAAYAAFVKGKQHEMHQRHQVLQEIRGSRGICGCPLVSPQAYRGSQ
jgi:hypothetical protein